MKQHAEHITPVKVYIAVGISLLILTGLTVTISFIDLGPYNITIALIIASIKALLVALFFMHIFWDNKLYLIIFSGALLFLTIFLTLTMFDTETRGSIDEQKAKPIKSEAPMYQKQ